jgi:hypothetical protein
MRELQLLSVQKVLRREVVLKVVVLRKGWVVC